MHTVNSVLFGAGFMLLDMGYQPEPGREDEVLSLAPAAEGQHPVNMHVVTRVARDCLLAGMECRLLADVHAAVTSKVPISMEEVIEFRRDHIGSVEVCSRELLYRKQQLSPEVRDLIHQLLQKNPADRIKLDKIVEHPWLRLQECPPSATAQDSGMFTMTTTNFSSNSNISRPGPRPLAAFPVLTEYSEESPGSQQVAGLTASRPPTPQLASLRHQLASLPSVASQASCRDTVREVSMVSAVSGLTRQVSTPCLQPRDSAQASLRSNYSDPALRPAPGPASVSAHQMSQHSHAPSPRPPSPSSLPPRLSSTRLRPTRQRNKNVMANISHNGEICLEFVKAKRGQELVSEVMRISGDGERIVIYSPAPGTPLGSAPPPIPGTGADSFHSYATLPTKYHKKYQYAARFVNLVKASTPKITLYTSQAKCYLMENDGGDFEAYFYSGTKVTVADGKITIKDQEGVSQVNVKKC